MIYQLYILFSIFTLVFSNNKFPSFKKNLVQEFNDLDDSGTLDLTGWNQPTQYDCSGSQIFGRFSDDNYAKKTYTNLPTYDFVEVEFKFYMIDSADNSGPLSGDIVIIRINNNQEEIQQGNHSKGIGTLLSQGFICGQTGEEDGVFLKSYSQFNYQSTTLEISIQTKYDGGVNNESWGIRDINVKLYTIDNTLKVHTINDLTGNMSGITGWSPYRTQQCVGGEYILGHFGGVDQVIKTYQSLPDYRFVMATIEIYLMDTVDYGDDTIVVYLNDVAELSISGKNFDSNFLAGTANYCGNPENDMIVPENLRTFGAETTQFKIKFVSTYGIGHNERWGLRQLTIDFYNYTPQCPSPAIIDSSDESWCNCPANSHVNDTNDGCVVCQNAQILNTNQDDCVCPASSYPNNTDDDCIFCNMPYILNSSVDGCDCNFSSGQLANFDSSICDCEVDYLYDSNTDTCVCNLSITNYFDSNNCQCQSSFVFNNDKSQCICPPQQIVISGSCQNCSIGEYFDNNACLTCDNSQCATCQTNATQCILPCNSDCTTCSTDGKCLTCQIGEFLQNSDKTCQQCDNTVCATCNTDSTTCDIFCNSDCKECDTTGQCTACEQHEFLSGGQCLPCDNQQCATCQISNDNCILGCNPDCQTCETNQQCLTCSDGKYLNNSGQCMKCDDTQCATCQTNSTTCILTCDSSCKHCNNTGNCIDCQDGYYLNSNSQLCEECDFQCQTCKNTSDTCLNCSHNTRDINNNCVCMVGFYQIAQNIECGVCSFKCETCTGSQDNCITCINSSRQNPPDCECSVGYYDDIQTGECLQCKYDCACLQYDNCSYCLQDDRQLRSPQDCSCKSGYYEDLQGKCQACHSKCQQCEGSPQNCTICRNEISRLQETPNCGCQKGYYEDQTTFECQKCGPFCAECENNQSCTSCANPFMRPPLCFYNFQGFFENVENNGTFSVCNIQCLTCENTADNCIQCSQGLNRTSILPECECKQGYHDNQNTLKDCVPCPILCETCSSFTTCETCVQYSYLNPITLQCECQPGYELDIKTEICKKCYYYLDVCYFQCPDNTIQDQKNQKCLSIEYQANNNTLIFYLSSVFIILALFSGILLFKIQKINKKQNIKNINVQDQDDLKL